MSEILKQRMGVILVVCAPSGAGKSTLIHKLLKQFPRLSFSVSCTSRKPRDGEVNGQDYNFITREKFRELQRTGAFAEWAEVHGNFYGTPLEPVKNHLQNDRDIIFDIDVQGAMQLKEHFPNGRYIFIFPPSFQALHDRLFKRGTDSPEVIAKRLHGAAAEIEKSGLFDCWIINDDLETAYEELKAAYISAALAPGCRPELPATLLQQWKELRGGFQA